MILEDGGKSFLRVNLVWKLVILFVAGVLGVYLFLSRADHGLSYHSLRLDPLLQAWRKEDFCPQRFAKLEFAQHYPRPKTYSRGECACTPVHNFVILSTQRSGSGWFETLLNSHPNITSHGEIFSVRPRRHNFSIVSHTLDALYNLDWHNSASKNSCTSVVGFKWMLNQGAMEYRSEVSSYFKRRGVSVILLIRRNGLKRLISILANAYDRRQPMNGTHVSHVHSEEAADLLASYKPTVDVAFLKNNLDRYDLMIKNALCAFEGTRLLVIYYEDFVKNRKEMQRTVQEFLSVPVMRLRSRQWKIHRGPLSQSVTNWKEVFRELNGTSYQGFLADDDYS
ncbi:uncharacterized protein LOC9643414 [Selaginella moellendorffii]|uniref:uncharacterized protein LOC9643414 n=1 Tax=Selaginella moellendorffii TaxID=88036 RepID=UPI000D1CD3A5|nr:uncharacterized protein LOC9643414 [Selaginella moellendorffii]|eukprot:XP_024524159.1 uncharacterized protein LOC9643414 [Selaginella moellendorffii]